MCSFGNDTDFERRWRRGVFSGSPWLSAVTAAHGEWCRNGSDFKPDGLAKARDAEFICFGSPLDMDSLRSATLVLELSLDAGVRALRELLDSTVGTLGLRRDVFDARLCDVAEALLATLGVKLARRRIAFELLR